MLHTASSKDAQRCKSEDWLWSGSWGTELLPRRPGFSSNALLLFELCVALTGPESLKLPSVPCCPKMAEPVLYRAAAAGSNYWLGPGKWGQMHCIIREPVDSGSPSQWLVINKIIGERWQRFLEFFLICLSFCIEFFMTSFFLREGWVANDTVSYRVACLWCGFKLRACSWREKLSSMCGVHLYTHNIQYLSCGGIQSHLLYKCYSHSCLSNLYTT